MSIGRYDAWTAAGLGAPLSGWHVKIITSSYRCVNSPQETQVALALTAESYDVVDNARWREFAACRDTSPDLFFPVGTTGPAIEQIAQAKTVCRTCEAQSACLEFALATNQDSGVWGGTSEEERRKLRKQYAARQRRTA